MSTLLQDPLLMENMLGQVTLLISLTEPRCLGSPDTCHRKDAIVSVSVNQRGPSKPHFAKKRKDWRRRDEGKARWYRSNNNLCDINTLEPEMKSYITWLVGWTRVHRRERSWPTGYVHFECISGCSQNHLFYICSYGTCLEHTINQTETQIKSTHTMAQDYMVRVTKRIDIIAKRAQLGA